MNARSSQTPQAGSSSGGASADLDSGGAGTAPTRTPAPQGKVVSASFLIAVGFAAVALVLGGLYLGTDLFRPPPHVIIANIQMYDERSCTGALKGGNVVFVFDLVNSGGPGFATVQLFRDGTLQLTKEYNMSARSTYAASLTQTLTDCDPYHWELLVLREWSP